MKKNTNTLAYIFSLLFLLIVTPVILYTPVQNEIQSGWMNGEFYGLLSFQILCLLGLSFYIYFNTKNIHWTQKYLMNCVVIVCFGFLYYVSRQYDPSFPTIAGMAIATVIFIMPVLLVFQGAIHWGKVIESNGKK